MKNIFIKNANELINAILANKEAMISDDRGCYVVRAVLLGGQICFGVLDVNKSAWLTHQDLERGEHKEQIVSVCDRVHCGGCLYKASFGNAKHALAAILRSACLMNAFR